MSHSKECCFWPAFSSHAYLIQLLFNSTDWLLDRRHCDIKWQGVVLEIRQKINAAIQDMPPVEEITQLLSGACRFD